VTPIVAWVASGGVKIKRAKKHIADLEAAIDTFRESNPYRIVAEIDEHAGHVTYTIRDVKDPDPAFGAIAGDAIHNLRSALDILWRHVCNPTGISPDSWSAEFPLAETSYSLERACGKNRKIESWMLSAVKILRQFKCHKGGDEWLCLLDTADKMDKHRLLFSTYAPLVTATVDPRRYVVPGVEGHALFARINYRGTDKAVKEGTIIYDEPLPKPPEVYVKPEITLEIAFGEGKTLKGKPMLDTLANMRSMVEIVVGEFIAEGLIP
jgi:hypothetical protein